MRTSVVRVKQVMLRREPTQRRQSQRLSVESFGNGGAKQRRLGSRQKRTRHSRRLQPLNQVQHLPLSASHFASGVEVQDSH
jgi:hypothetical protein